MGEARLSEDGWGGLSDLYEPYLLLKEMSGNSRAESKKSRHWLVRPRWGRGQGCFVMSGFGAKHSPEYFRIGHTVGASRPLQRVGGQKSVNFKE